MNNRELQAENRDLRRKLQDALKRAAEMETNPPLKAAMEHVAVRGTHHGEKKLDPPKSHG